MEHSTEAVGPPLRTFSLFPHLSGRPTLKDYWELLVSKLDPSRQPLAALRWPTRTPNHYWYDAIATGPGGVVVFRDAMSGSGCVIERCFSDWLMLNPKNGKRISGGTGELLGIAGSSAVLRDGAAITWFDKGRIKELSPSGAAKHPLPFMWPGFGRNSQQYRCNHRCVFHSPDGTSEEIFVFDERTQEVSSFKASCVPRFQVNCVLLDEYLLRYAERRPNSGSPCFELYDLRGECIARTEVAAIANSDDEWYLSFLGTSAAGKVFFYNGEQRIAVEIPSLKTTTFPPRRANLRSRDGSSYTSRHMVRGSNQFYDIEGNATISVMTKDPLPHDLRINVLDVETGQQLWSHVEHVNIRKFSDRAGISSNEQ